MRRVLLLLALILCFQNSVFAEQTNFSFMYINGSNNNNRKMRVWFENGIKKFHPTIKHKFETNRETKEWFNSETGIYHINEEPVIFFWGDKSQNELEWVKQQLDFSKAIGASFAYKVRSTLTAYLHDAIWVQKEHNMIPIVAELNNRIKEEYAKGNEVVLYGYSAGTFITYQYLNRELPYINLQRLFEVLNVDNDIIDFVKANPQPDTCTAALEEAKIGFISEKKHFIFDSSERFKTKYANLKSITDRVCMPKGALRGVINYASPLPLFYSDLADPDFEMTFQQAQMIRYIYENGIFLLTVNFKEDPMGFPTTRNLTLQEVEELVQEEYNDPSGMIYDNSSVWSKRSVLFAHTSYWSAKGTFANAIVKTLSQGMKFNYDKDYQAKMLKKRSKDFSIW